MPHRYGHQDLTCMTKISSSVMSVCVCITAFFFIMSKHFYHGLSTKKDDKSFPQTQQLHSSGQKQERTMYSRFC